MSGLEHTGLTFTLHFDITYISGQLHHLKTNHINIEHFMLAVWWTSTCSGDKLQLACTLLVLAVLSLL